MSPTTRGEGGPTPHATAVLLDLLGRRWALRVLWELSGEPLGFRALQDRCDHMSSSVLRDRLAELGDAGIVTVDEAGRYRLTPQGAELVGPLEPLSPWADRWARRMRSR